MSAFCATFGNIWLPHMLQAKFAFYATNTSASSYEMHSISSTSQTSGGMLLFCGCNPFISSPAFRLHNGIRCPMDSLALALSAKTLV